MPEQDTLLFSHSKRGVAFQSVLWYLYNKMDKEPRGPQAARWRQRKYVILRRYAIPEDLLPGSLSLSHLRCGKPTCHCAKGQGHSVWSLTFMVNGKKQVQHIPKDWVEEVRKRVDAGREFQDAVREVLTANAQLLVLTKKQRRR
jgi:hypothetical protein